MSKPTTIMLFSAMALGGTAGCRVASRNPDTHPDDTHTGVDSHGAQLDIAPKKPAAALTAGPQPKPPEHYEAVSPASYHTCAIKGDGSVTCWGNNDDGEASPPAGSFSQLSAGGGHTCGVRSDGSIACWGFDKYGQASPPTGTFSEVSAGHRHSCGVRGDGSVACWGSNDEGQASPPAGVFSQLSAGYGHSCGVKGDGSVVCWGNNKYGQAAPPTGTFSQVSAGTEHSCGLRSDGSVVCWGNDEHGQASPPAGTFSQIDVGSFFGCGVKHGGVVACWGHNGYDQVMPPVGSFSQFGAGDDHGCAVKDDGLVACWGNSEYGKARSPLEAGAAPPAARAPLVRPEEQLFHYIITRAPNAETKTNFSATVNRPDECRVQLTVGHYASGNLDELPSSQVYVLDLRRMLAEVGTSGSAGDHCAAGCYDVNLRCAPSSTCVSSCQGEYLSCYVHPDQATFISDRDRVTIWAWNQAHADELASKLSAEIERCATGD